MTALREMTRKDDAPGQVLSSLRDQQPTTHYPLCVVALGGIGGVVTSYIPSGAVDKGKIRLMGMAEIAERLRLSRERASQLANRRDFPEPAARLKMGQVWLADDVDEWVRVNRPYLDDPDDA